MTSKRILIIDNSRELLEVARIALEEVTSDWEVLTATLGQEGIGQARSEHPDAILLDVMLPDIDGFTVLKMLKADSKTQKIPVIFLTSKTRLDAPEQFQEAEAEGLINKPLNFVTLAHQVSSILGWQV